MASVSATAAKPTASRRRFLTIRAMAYAARGSLLSYVSFEPLQVCKAGLGKPVGVRISHLFSQHRRRFRSLAASFTLTGNEETSNGGSRRYSGKAGGGETI